MCFTCRLSVSRISKKSNPTRAFKYTVISFNEEGLDSFTELIDLVHRRRSAGDALQLIVAGFVIKVKQSRGEGMTLVQTAVNGQLNDLNVKTRSKPAARLIVSTCVQQLSSRPEGDRLSGFHSFNN